MSDLISAEGKQAVHQEQIKLLYHSLPGAIFSSLGLVVFTVVALWGVADTRGLLLWSMAHGLLSTLRLLWVRCYKRSEQQNLPQWTSSFLVLVFVNGSLWGSLLLMYDIDWPLPFQFMAWIIYPGVVAGAVMTLSAYNPAFVTFVSPLIVSCAWALLSVDGNEYGMMLLILAVFFTCVLMAGRKHNHTLVDAIEARMRLQEANRKLMQLATRDALTGVPNRRAFEYQLQREWGRSQRQQIPIALLMVDVDHFKDYNDRFGHSVGDSCLREVASAIANQLHRASDLATRYGGEEFALLLPDTERAGALVVAENILCAVRQIKVAEVPGGGSITVSIGVGHCTPERGDDSAQLVDEADKALYRAKEAGRDLVL